MRRNLAAFLSLSLLIACSPRSDAGLKILSLDVGTEKIKVELALTPGERQTGLMNRKELAPDRGMLFVFEEEAPRSFWMKNTLISLSIAYLDREGNIIDIQDMAPLNTTPVPSAGPAMYALEVNRGMFSRWGVSVGDRIDLSGLKSHVQRR